MKKTPFNTIVLGFFFFNVISDVFLKLTHGNDTVIGGIKIIGLFFILRGFFAIYHTKNFLPSKYNLLLNLYKLICLVMIVRGYTIDYQYQWVSTAGMINYHLFQPFYILCYLMPFAANIDYNLYDYGNLMKLATKCAKVSIVLFLMALPFLLQESSQRLAEIGSRVTENVSESKWILPYTIFSFFSFFVLLVSYQSKKDRKWILGGLLTVLIGGLLLGRRGRCAINTLYFLFPMYMWLKKIKRGKLIGIIILALLTAGTLYFLFNSSLTTFITARGLEDTRSGVDVALMNQMDSWEVLFGKGLNGRYYYPLREDDYLNGWRYGSETGFFNLVLKGGFLMAFVYILLLAIPAFKGMIKSNNTLCKASGYYIFVSLIELYPFGWLMFDIKFLIIWMGIVICMNPQIRKMNDSQIYALFFNKQKI